ncbi:MAG: hypothetical protein IPP71_15300 [Bacteroidetes bacterium]|nr:hypothetical protein [Bacteroidota bacterium]
MKIDNYISELLYDHDCVIVTDLGGFIANHKPASINPALHVIHPPSKKLAFNSSLKNNDGLLASHISQREALNYSEANEVIREYVKEALANFKNGQKLKIEKVGLLYLDNESNVQFVPDQNVNYLISSFGLSALHSPLIKREVNIPVETHVPKIIPLPKSQPKSQTERKPFKWKVIEVIPAAAVLAFLFMVPPVLYEFNNNLSTLLPFSRINEYIDEMKGESKAFQPIKFEYKSPFEVPPAKTTFQNEYLVSESKPDIQITPAAQSNETLALTPDEPVVETVKKEMKTVTPVSIDVQDDTYFVIGGCFRLKENADKFMAEMKTKGNDAVLIGQNKAGLFMVSLFSSASYTQTTDALPEIKSNAVESAWIYKK